MGSQTVLVVDDDPTMRLCLARMLRAKGYDVAIAADAPSALGLVRKEPPAAIVLDVVLEGFDGLRLCAHLRESSADAGPKIVMVSARSSADDIDRGLAAGADVYLPKPFAMHTLMDRLGNLLADGRA